MFKYLLKVLYILSGSYFHLGLLLASFVFVSILEALGVGLIAPFLSIAGDPDIARSNGITAGLLNLLNLQTDGQIVTGLALILIAIFCIKTAAYFLCKFYIFKYSYWQKSELERRLMHTYLRVPYAFHLNKNSAVLIKNITVEAYQFAYNSLVPLLEIVANVIVMIVLLELLAFSDLSLLTMALVIILPILLVFVRISRRARAWGKAMSVSSHNMIVAINHGIGGLKETKVIGCEEHFEQELHTHSKAYAKASLKADSFRILPRVSIEAILVIFLLSFIVFSQLFSDRSLGELATIMGMFAVASIRLVPAVSQILCALGQIRSSLYSVEMIYLDLKEIERFQQTERGLANLSVASDETPLVPASASVSTETMDFNYDISLEHLTYRYPAAKETAIKDLSLTIRKGESIALVGKSGSGKTTLVDILLGLLEPESGDIKVDGKSVYTDMRGWRNLLGYIPQSIFLTDNTIEGNIAYGVPKDEVDPVKLQEAIEAAQLQDLIDSLPDGVKTNVGERGVRVSGGQRQRIGIARALYHSREILVLDEATSALDSDTEKLVSDAINSLAGSKTLVIIAHRLSTIKNCDRIYRLNNGYLEQSGSYEEVLMTKA